MSDLLMLADTEAERTAWPAFPGENPNRLDLSTWVEAWRGDFTTAGYGAILRKDLPYDIKKLKERPLLAVPADAAVAVTVTAENEKIKYQNELIVVERNARIRELKTRMHAKLQKGMRDKARTRLEELEKKFTVTDTEGITYIEGDKMFFELEALVKTADVGLKTRRTAATSSRPCVIRSSNPTRRRKTSLIVWCC